MIGPSKLTFPDICSFFDSGYEMLAKEMKRRYPKHHWPDNPKSKKLISFLNGMH